MKRVFSFVGRLFRFLWRVVSFLSSMLANLFFLILLVLILSIFIFDREPDIPNRAALILALEGNIVEQQSESMLSSDLFREDRKDETVLKDIIDAVDFARDDERIPALVLDTSKMGRAGTSKLQDIGAALTRFKIGGKKVIAAADYYNQSQYYLAAHADQVSLDPMGSVILTGFGLYRKYFKRAIEKLLVQVHVFRVGTYKSALEPFLREDMSMDAKEANQAWLDVLWGVYKTDVAGLRGLDPDAIDDYINNISKNLSQYSGNVAEMALNHGLVDSLKTRAEIHREMAGLVGEDKARHTYNQIRLDDYLEIIRPDLMATDPEKATVGIIIAQGMILDGTQPAGKIGGDSIARLLRQVRRDDKIKSVVLRIDSGGGSPLASEVIRREVKMTRNAGKPVVVSMGSTAASGGYWIAVAADEIWAAPTTITGSIGIFGAFATFEKSLGYLGIQSDGVGTTRLADAFDPGRPLNPLLADTLQLIVEEGYRRFIHQVAEGRNMAPEAVEKIAQGRVWSGKTALEIGLVDKLGNLQDAIHAAASMAGLEDVQPIYMEQPLTTRERLIKSLKHLISTTVENSVSISTHPAAQMVDAFESDIEQLLLLNDPHGIYAYCMVCDGP